MIEVTDVGKVIYKTEHNAVGRFPEPGDEELAAGPVRSFQVFAPLDFLHTWWTWSDHSKRLSRRILRRKGGLIQAHGMAQFFDPKTVPYHLAQTEFLPLADIDVDGGVRVAFDRGVHP